MASWETEFTKSLDNAEKLLLGELAIKTEKACLVVKRKAMIYASDSVDNGFLRSRIDTDVKMNSNEILGLIGTNVEYAPFVHKSIVA